MNDRNDRARLQREADAALGQAERASEHMVRKHLLSRTLTISMAALLALGVALADLAATWVYGIISVLLVGTILAQWSAVRRRAKPRVQIGGSASAGGYALLGIIMTQCFRFWSAQDLASVSAKALIAFCLFALILQKIDEAYIRDAIHESQKE